MAFTGQHTHIANAVAKAFGAGAGARGGKGQAEPVLFDEEAATVCEIKSTGRCLVGKSVRNEEKWDGRWPRFDPSRGYVLCSKCWNQQHFNPPFVDKDGIRRKSLPLCQGDGCGCGCLDKGPKRIKFTGEGQTKIPMDDALKIGPRS